MKPLTLQLLLFLGLPACDLLPHSIGSNGDDAGEDGPTEGDDASETSDPATGGATVTSGAPTTDALTGGLTTTVGDTITGGPSDTDTAGGTQTGGETPVGALCDGFPGLACDEDQFCFHEFGVCSIIADAQGECRTIPDACPPEFDPVCGCDGNDYDSPCAAHAAGTSVAHDDYCDATVDPDMGLCITTDGTWMQHSCGHYECGVPIDCAANQPGCDCGPSRNFVDGEGCVEDPSC